MKKIGVILYAFQILSLTTMSQPHKAHEMPVGIHSAIFNQNVISRSDTASPSAKGTINSKTYTGFLKFIPEGYSLLDTATGDLNLDSYPDMLLALKKDGEEQTSDVTEHPEKRPLMILLGQPEGTFRLAAKNDNSIYCVDCGGVMGDPYQSMVIKKGFFSIEHYGGSAWRWTRIVTFKYNVAERKWFLFKDGGDSFHTADPGKVRRTVKTVKDFGKVPFEKFDIYKDE